MGGGGGGWNKINDNIKSVVFFIFSCSMLNILTLRRVFKLKKREDWKNGVGVVTGVTNGGGGGGYLNIEGSELGFYVRRV